MRLKIQPYGISKSAKALAEFLNIQRLKVSGSKFRARPSDVIIPWGVPKTVLNAQYVNPLEGLRTATNKLATFRALQAAGVSIPTFGTNCSFADDSSVVFARTTLSGHSGEGIEVGQPSEVPSAPLYTEFIDKQHEYRAIVCAGEVVDFKQKLKKRDFEGERSPYVWNVANGYIFVRNNIRVPEQAYQLSIDTIQALGLVYGAVDLIEDAEGVLYVLEINTAFGLEGSTTELFGNKLKAFIEENY